MIKTRQAFSQLLLGRKSTPREAPAAHRSRIDHALAAAARLVAPLCSIAVRFKEIVDALSELDTRPARAARFS